MEERDGALSAIRIIDTVTLTIPDSTPNDHAVPVALALLLVFKTDESPGKHEVRIDMRSPTGKVKKGLEQPIELSEQPYGGCNLKVTTTIMVKKGGVFWADIYLDGDPVTHTPLNVVVDRVQVGAGGDVAAEKPVGRKKPHRRPIVQYVR